VVSLSADKIQQWKEDNSDPKLTAKGDHWRKTQPTANRHQNRRKCLVQRRFWNTDDTMQPQPIWHSETELTDMVLTLLGPPPPPTDEVPGYVPLRNPSCRLEVPQCPIELGDEEVMQLAEQETPTKRKKRDLESPSYNGIWKGSITYDKIGAFYASQWHPHLLPAKTHLQEGKPFKIKGY
jgi:hypothetical protein